MANEASASRSAGEHRAGAVLQHLAELLPLADLSRAVDDEHEGVPAVRSQRVEECLREAGRRLHRSQSPHLLLVGRRGVGKTSIVRLLGRHVAQNRDRPPSDCQFLWLDCRNVGPEDSRACLETIFAAMAQLGGECILCLDGIAALLKRPQGGTNKPLLRTLLSRPGLRVVGVMEGTEFNEQIGSDAAMLDCFSRIDIPEPGDAETLEIVRHHARQLVERTGLSIGDHDCERLVALSSAFILAEAQPKKSVRLLHQVFDDAVYERDSLGQERKRIELGDIEAALSEKTGIPAAVIAGQRDEIDIEAILSDAVVGQLEAIREVANELRLIKAGLSEPGKPAGVFLFAGMTGVGKTELAKRIAELYSTTKRLQTYAMGNYTEPHSVSGMIGVPPGYVGHEDGGRLVNELNADPYSVFLLDEAEKCHPNIWKPFLNLFDEGWLIDQRGMKAYADRAIFILTTNAGDRNVAQMTKSGKSPEEITEQVKKALANVRHERSSQPVFPPQFLSRIRRIIVFNALDEEAMIGITQRVCRRMSRLWLQKREKRLQVADEVIETIGKRAYVLNESCNGQEGGRIVKKLVSDTIERSVQDAAVVQADMYAGSTQITVRLGAGDESGAPSVNIEFGDGGG